MLLQVEALTPFFSNSNWKQHVTSVLLMGEISSNCEKNKNVKRKQLCEFSIIKKSPYVYIIL
jgi:hypothetical protein